ncbi:MAG TPA: hypothetical protein VJV96_19265 [Candidatus Angelobacter sp.]|nr:hypothetical protein [Candidatus Angelobacter sp.]
MNTDRPSWKLGVALCLSLLLSYASAQKKDDSKRHYGLISGTAYGPDDRPLYGVRITIHPEGKKHPSWDLVSDHRGEFAQRVPPGPEDYIVDGQVELAPLENGIPQLHKKKKLRDQVKVHIDNEEIRDISVHMKE